MIAVGVGFEAVTVGTEGAEVGRIGVLAVTVDVVDIKLAGMLGNEAAIFAGRFLVLQDGEAV